MSLKEIPLDPQKSHKLKQKLTETVDQINDRIFKPMSQPRKPKHGDNKSEQKPFNFMQRRREWEEMIDAGNSFSWMSEKFPIKKEWRCLLTCVQAKERSRITQAKQRREIIADLHQRGITDEDQIKEQVLLKQWQLKRIHEKKQHAKTAIVDPTKISIHMSQFSNSTYSHEEEDPTQLDADFKGIETKFEFQALKAKRKNPFELEDRNLRVIKARERLNKKKAFKEDQVATPLVANEEGI